MNNVVDTARGEGWQEGIEAGRQEGREAGIEAGRQTGIEEGQRSLLHRLLLRTLGELPEDLKSQIDRLSLANLEALTEVLLDFTDIDDLVNWLKNH